MIRTVFILPVIAMFAWAQAAPEVRGVWVARDSLGSREQIRTMMQTLADANFNAAFINCWSRGYPLWPSDVFEKETGIRIDPGYAGRDVLREAIEEGKPLGISVIPWFEYGFVGGFSGYLPGTGRRGPIFDRHPEWLAKTRTGEVRFPIAGGGDFFWMIHTHPDVQEFLIQLVEEVVRNYDVQVVEFDRARYPQLDCGYDDVTKEAYAAENGGMQPPENPNDGRWLRWRSEKLNAFIRRLTQRVKAVDWRILMTNAPIVYPFGYVMFAQDWPAWVREGSLDFVSPQVYRPDVAQYERELASQNNNIADLRRMVPGIDITNSRSGENLAEQIRIARERKTGGVVVWYYESLRVNRAFEVLKSGVFAEKAPLPWR